jgi:arylsulfatase A
MPLDRRDFVKSLAASVAAPAVPQALNALESTQKTGDRNAGKDSSGRRAPNVILMICDDLGYGDLGCYGSKLPTPNLDAMAESGLRFTHCNAAHPICSASRAALLTGRYGTRSGTYGAFSPSSTGGTSLDETLLSSLFQARGYKTKAIGKWHLGHQPPYLPTMRGFDSFYGVPYSVDMKPLPLMRDTAILEQDTDREQLTPRYTTEAVQFIDAQAGERGGGPFFLYLGFSYPHDPASGSARFKGKTRFGNSGDAIAEIDWSVGEIVNALRRKRLVSDTLILFTSDHGPWYQGSAGLLRGRKASTFEGGFRVPLLAQWEGTLARAQVRDAWISNLDILPTLAALCGLGLPAKPLDGVDVSGVLLGSGAAPKRKPVLYFSPMGDGSIDVHCIRSEQWKLRVAQCTGGEIYLNDRTTSAKTSGWLQHPELYDLSDDAAESYDVAHLHPEIVSQMEQSLEEQIASFPGHIVDAYTKLKQKPGDISTPAGASPRPYHERLPDMLWEPPDRRDS